jgi:hypothetical protein
VAIQLEDPAMAMPGGTISGLFDPTTCSSSSPTAANQQAPAAFKRSEGFVFFGTGDSPAGRRSCFLRTGELFLQPILAFHSTQA